MLLKTVLDELESPPRIVIEPALLADAAGLVNDLGLGKNYAIVCDSNTRPLLSPSFQNCQWLQLPGTPVADTATVEVIRRKTAKVDFLIALGSGTINDLCKYASFLDNKPYIVFPTAPSMNGYISANASITVNGHKKSLNAHIARAVLCDLDILCSAPPRLIKSGLGDSLCRPTCQADWLLSHLLLDTPYDPLPFTWLRPYEKDLFEHCDALLNGDREIMRLLITTLLVSGMGMVHAGGSYPASQGEHLIAHAMEMSQQPHDRNNSIGIGKSFHGEQIAVTTLTMSAIQHSILESDPPPLLNMTATDEDMEKNISSYFGSSVVDSVIGEYRDKCRAVAAADAAARLAENWHTIRDKIAEITLPPATLKAILLRADCPVTPSALGWEEENYRRAVNHARFIRNRFTFLDIRSAP